MRSLLYLDLFMSEYEDLNMSQSYIAAGSVLYLAKCLDVPKIFISDNSFLEELHYIRADY